MRMTLLLALLAIGCGDDPSNEAGQSLADFVPADSAHLTVCDPSVMACCETPPADPVVCPDGSTWQVTGRRALVTAGCFDMEGFPSGPTVTVEAGNLLGWGVHTDGGLTHACDGASGQLLHQTRYESLGPPVQACYEYCAEGYCLPEVPRCE